VGDAANPLLYTQYNPATQELAFRLRMESVDGKGVYYLLGIAGDPAGTTLDFFIGVYVPPNGSTPEVRFYDVGTGLNNSPLTTSFSLASSVLAAGQAVAITTTGSHATDNDLDSNGKLDGFVSFKLDGNALVSFARGAGGLTGYTLGTQVGMVLVTSTQTGSIDGDIAGVDGMPDGSWPLTPVVLDNALPTSANGSATINEDAEHVFVSGNFAFADTDPSDTALQSVRITGLPAQGELRYNNADNWTEVTVGQHITATDIAAGKLKFVPATDGNGSPYAQILFKVSDGKSESAASYAFTVHVTPVNDAPVLSQLDGDVAYWSTNNIATPIDPFAAVTIRDIDSPNFDGGRLTLTLSGGVASENRLSVVDFGSITLVGSEVRHTGTAIGSVDATYNGSYHTTTNPGSELRINLNSSATAAKVTDLVQALRYTYVGSDAVSALRTLSLVLTDGDGGNSATQTVTLVGPPVYPVSGYEDTPLGFTASDHGIGSSDTVKVTHLGNTLGNWTYGSGTAVVAGTTTLTAAQFDTLRYTPASNDFGDGASSLSFKFVGTANTLGFDSAGLSLIEPTLIINLVAVNDAPTLDLNGAAAGTGTTGHWTERDGTESATRTVPLTATDFSLSDVDNATLTSLRLSGHVHDGDRLVAGDQVLDLMHSGTANVLAGGVTFVATITSDGSTAQVVFTHASAPASVSTYQALLGSLAYTHLSDSPNTEARVWRIAVNDGALSSEVATATIQVTATNDTPTASNLPAQAEYDWGRDIATTLFPQVSLQDLDGTVQTATLTITGSQAGDRLNFTDTLTVTGTWNAVNQTLTLSNSGSTADLAAALRTVTFSSTLDTNRTVFVETRLTDNGGASTQAATTAVKLHSVRPSIDLQTASDTGSSSSDNITHDTTPTFDVGVPSDAQVGDVLRLLAADGTVLASVTLTEAQITAATVAMTPTAALANGAQTLIARLVRTGASAELAIVVDNVAPGFANQSHDYLEGQSADTVVATVSASDVSELTGFVITAGNDDGYFSIDSQGRIRITATGAAAEANDFETGANSFTLTVSATDAAGNTTSGTTVTLHVLNKDEASPVLLAQTRSFAEGQALGTVLATVAASDDIGVTSFGFRHADGSVHATSEDGFFAIDDSGQIRLTVAGAQSAANDFETTPNSVTHTVQVTDAAGKTAHGNVTLSVTNVNDAPVLLRTANHSVTYEEGGAAVAAAPGLSVGDQDNSTLASAVVSISSGHLSGDDVLGFVNAGTVAMGNITASYSSGQLTLTSAGATATLAQWQNALRAVTFSTSSVQPGEARTLSWQVNDGAADSAVVSTSVVIREHYTEQEAAFSPVRFADFGTLSGKDFADTGTHAGTLSFAITSATATETLALRTVSAADTGSGVVSVVVDAGVTTVHLGSGSAATAIATVSGGMTGSNLVVTANADFPADHTVMQKIALLVTYHNSSDLSAANTSQTRTLTVTATAADGDSNSFTQSIKLIELNDAVNLAQPDTISYTDTAANDSFTATSDTLIATDPDSGTTLSYGLSGGTPSGSELVMVGTYGTLRLNSSTGAYTYTPDAAAINALTGNATDTFTVTASDGSGSTANRTLTFNLTGANDTPQVVLETSSITYVDTGAIAYTTSTGNFSSSDRDTSAAPVTFAIMDSSSPVLTLAGTYGTLTITNAATGAYSFAPNATAINALSAGQSDSDTFTIQVSDGTLSSTATFTVHAVGANSTPQFLGGPVTKFLTESNAGLSTTGSLSLADVDINDTITVSSTLAASGNRGEFAASNDATLLAMLTLSSDNTSFGATATPADGTQERALYWTFNSGSEAFNHLAQGETLVLTYTLTATDNAATPLSGTQTVTVTITGTNDAPVITVVGGNANTAALSEGGTLTQSGTLTVTDADTSNVVSAGAVLTSSNTGTSSRTDPAAPSDAALQAMFSVSPSPVLNGTTSSGPLTWTFNAGAETFDYLAQGETLVLVYTVTATDDAGTPLSGSATVTITITGTNDAPTMSATRTAVAYTDTAADDSFSTVTGTLSSTDVDTSDAATYGIVGGSANSSRAGFNVARAGAYGTLYLNSVNGRYEFVPDDAAIEARLTNASEFFTFSVFDGTATVSTQTFTVTITATNDTPILTAGTATATLVEAGGVANAVAGVASSSVTLSKSDRDGTANFDSDWLVDNGWITADANATFTKTGTYGTATLTTATGVVSYALDNDLTATQALTAGQTVSETFAIQVTDGAATADAQAVFTIQGSNDAPVLAAPAAITYADTGINDSFATVNGTLSASDVDGTSQTYSIFGQTANSSVAGFTHSKTGNFGTLYLNSNTGAYQYVPNRSAINAATGPTGEEFTVLATDSAGATGSQTLSIVVNGDNDTPTLVAVAPRTTVQPGTLYESDSPLTATGRLVAGDRDASTTLTVATVSGSSTARLNTGTVDTMSSDQFGWLTVSPTTITTASADVVWTFNSSAETFDDLLNGDVLTLTYVVSVSDGTATTTSNVTITIYGTNDAPVISIDTSGTPDSAQAALTENNSASRIASGTLSVSDKEVGDTLTPSVASVTVHASSTASSGAIPSNADLLAMMSVAPTPPGTTVRGTHALTWTFNSGAQTFNALAAGETLVLDYTIRVNDSTIGTATQTVRVTLTGTNDAPVVTPVGVTGSIASGFPAQLFDSGSITFTDLDVSDRPVTSVVTKSVTGAVRGGAAGSLTLTAGQLAAVESAFSITNASNNTNNGTVNWNYNITQANLDFLGSGQTVTAVFTITVTDTSGATASQDVTISLAGKNNAPVISLGGSDSRTASETENGAAVNLGGTLTVSDSNQSDTLTATVLTSGSTLQRNDGAVVAMTASERAWLRLGVGNGPDWTVLNSTNSSAPLNWTFDSGSETFRDLAAGETLTLVYRVQVVDDADNPLTATDTITLTITGTNDAPVITSVVNTAALTETDAGLQASGSMTVADADTVNTVTASRALTSVTGTSSRTDPAAPTDAQLLAMLRLSADNTSWSTSALTLINSSSTSGTLYWQFDSGSEVFNYLAAGETLVVTYTVTATDSNGTPANDTETITITITGSNDAPVITQGPDAADLLETNIGLVSIGTLTVTDVDTSDVVTAARTLVVSGSSNRSDPAAPSDGDLLAMFNLTPSGVLGATQNTATLNWRFDSGSQSFDYLAVGQTLVLTYTVTATDDDGTALADSETVTVTITGSNDAPVISVIGQDSDSAALTETNAALTAQGTLSVSDVDRADTVSASVLSVATTGQTVGLPSNNTALLAMLGVTPSTVVGNTDTGGSLTWSFNSGSEVFNYLAHGEQLVLTYTVRLNDGTAMVDKTVVITISGSNDAPTVSIAQPAAFVEAVDASVQVLAASGSVDFVDLDASDQITVSFQVAAPVVWSGGALPATLAQSLLDGFSVSASPVSVTTPVSWTYSHEATDFNFLKAGQTITFSYTVVVTDAQGQSASAPVSFTLNGANDVPTLQPLTPIVLTDTEAEDRFASVVGSLTGGDLDAGDVLTFSVSLDGTHGTPATADSSRDGYDYSVSGTYGTMYLNSRTGAYEYVPDDAAINGLTGSDASESFTFTVTDSSGNTATRTLPVTLVADDDTPTLSASQSSANYVNTTGDDNFVPVTGTLAGYDRGTGVTLTYGITGATADTSLAGYDLSKTSLFGTLYVNSVTGAYAYVPDKPAIEAQAAGATTADSFSLTVSNGTLSSDTPFTAWIVGAAPVPTISGGGNTIELTSDGSSLSANGSLSVTDSNLSDAVNVAASVMVGGATGATDLPSEADLLAMLSLSPTSVLSDGSNTTGAVSWRFNSGSELFDFLAEGETLELTYTITATDTGTPPSSGSTTITLIVTGTNDRPTLVTPVTISLSDTTEDDSFSAVTGTLLGADRDHNAVLTYSIAGQTAGSFTVDGVTYDASRAGRYGTLYLDTDTGAYVYVADDTTIEALKDDSSDIFSVRVSDGSLSATQSLNVLISGRNDTPALAAVSALPYTDTAGNDSFGAVTGQLAGSDRDGDALSYQISGAVNEVRLIGGQQYDTLKVGRLGTLYLNSTSGAYRFEADGVAMQGLKSDASENFGLTVSDGAAFATQVLTINVTAANDTPGLSASVTAVTYTDTAALDRFSSVTGSLVSSDRDQGDSATYSASLGVAADSADTSRNGYDRSLLGAYGRLYLNSQTGAYEYVPNDAAINALTGNANESFSLKVTDGSGAHATQALTISLAGANDTPTLSASVPSTTYLNTSGADSFSAVTGTLTSADRDTGASLVYGMVGETAEDNTIGMVLYNRKVAGNYGTLYLNSSTGAYRYVPDGTAMDALTANASERFVFEVSDGDLSRQATFDVSVISPVDTPTFSDGADEVDLTAAGGTLSASGSFTVTSDNLDDSVTLATTVAIGGTSTGTPPTQADLLALLSLSPASPVLSDRTSRSTPVTWTFNGNSSLFSYLAEGETLVLTFNITGSETGNEASAGSTTITLTITGTNDRPTLSAPAGIGFTDTAANDSFSAVTGTLVGADVDHNAVLDYSIAGQTAGSYTVDSVVYDASRAGRFGTLYLNSSGGAYVYVPDAAAIQGLKTDTSESFSLVVSDGSLSAAQTLTVSVTATNDAPTLSASLTTHTYTDTAATDRFAGVAGSLTSSDRDSADTATFSASLGANVDSAETARPGYNRSLAGSYGKLFLNSSTGAYLYVPSDAAINALTGDTTETFTLQVTDGSGAQASQALTFTLVGTNDVPVVTNNASATVGTVTEAGHLDDGTATAGTPTASGTLSRSDVDAGATVAWSLQGSPSTTYGTMALNPNTGVWTYTLDNSLAATQALKEGEVVTQSYVARATDDFGAYVDQTLTVTINGTNDVPVVTNTASATVGTVTEAGHLDDGTATAGTPTASGTLSRSDVDASATVAWSLQGSPSTTYGTMALNANTGVWTYTLDNSLAATQALKEGEVVTQSYVARATDDFGAYVEQTLTVTLNGTNDVPVISSSAAQANGTVVEQGHNDEGVITEGVRSVSNQISVSDVDQGATRIFELEGTPSNRYGSMALDSETGVWTYTLDNTLLATQNLREGQSVQQQYTVRVTDDRGAQVRETITVTIEGSNDVPTVVGQLAAEDYLQGERFEMATAQLFTDIDLDAGNFTYSAQLPPGVTIDALTGLISGAGTRPGDYRIVIRATDAQGAWAETTWDVRINAPAQTDNAASLGIGSRTDDAGGTAGGSNTTTSTNNTGGSGSFNVLNDGIAGFTGTIQMPSWSSLSSGTTLGSNTNASDSGTGASSGTAGINAGSTALADGNLGSGSAPGSTADSITGASTAFSTSSSSGPSDGSTGTSSSASGATGTTGSGGPSDSSGSSGSTESQANTSNSADSAPQAQDGTTANVGADGQLQLSNASDATDTGNANSQNTTRSAERVDVSVNANGQISLRQEAPEGNDSPTGIMLVEVAQQGNELQIEIADFRRSEVSQYRATLPDGSDLPSWIQIDPTTGQVTVDKARAGQLIEMKFIAQDIDGGLRTLDIKIDLSQQQSQNEFDASLQPQAQSRPAFMTQLAAHSQQWNGYGEQLMSVFTE